ncbi:MAG: ISL3 family transposase [Akkermansiaceae bacterium]
MFLNLKIGLKDYHTLQASQDNGLQLHVELKSEFEPKCCPHCQCSRIQSKGRYLRKVRHLDCFQEPTRLFITSRRFRCLTCGRFFIPDFPGIIKGRHTSEPYRQTIFEQHHQGVCTRTIARRQGLGEATVERIYRQFTGRKAAERISLQCHLVLGIDEHTLHKGQRFCTTFCDLKNHRIFEIHPGRSEADLACFLSKLKGRERVQLVCIDLSSPYRRLVQRYFPNARVVADRFHVIRIINRHFIQLGRLLVPKLKNHRGYLAAMRKKPSRLNTRQKKRLQELFVQHPVLEPFYQNLHQIRQLMNQKNKPKKQCSRLIKQLLRHIRELKDSSFKPLETLARTLWDWMEPIACMWRFTKNNGITEGFHRKMKLIQRRAYGFKNFENYRLRVIAQCG